MEARQLSIWSRREAETVIYFSPYHSVIQMQLITKTILINSIVFKGVPHKTIQSKFTMRGLLLKGIGLNSVSWDRRQLSRLSCEELAGIYAKMPPKTQSKLSNEHKDFVAMAPSSRFAGIIAAERERTIKDK